MSKLLNRRVDEAGNSLRSAPDDGACRWSAAQCLWVTVGSTHGLFARVPSDRRSPHSINEFRDGTADQSRWRWLKAVLDESRRVSTGLDASNGHRRRSPRSVWWSHGRPHGQSRPVASLGRIGPGARCSPRSNTVIYSLLLNDQTSTMADVEDGATSCTRPRDHHEKCATSVNRQVALSQLVDATATAPGFAVDYCLPSSSWWILPRLQRVRREGDRTVGAVGAFVR